MLSIKKEQVSRETLISHDLGRAQRCGIRPRHFGTFLCDDTDQFSSVKFSLYSAGGVRVHYVDGTLKNNLRVVRERACQTFQT